MSRFERTADRSGGEPSPEPAHDCRVSVIPPVAAGIIRVLRRLVRLVHDGDGPLRDMERRDQRVIIAFWHRHLLLMRYAYRGRRVSVLISRHRDGELIARTVAHLGIEATRGSTSRGGSAALRTMVRLVRDGYDLAFTPDGPRGPAGKVKPGVIKAAALANVPIQPVALACTRSKVLGSWDRFVIPLPLSRVCLSYAEPLVVGRRDDPESKARELEERLRAAEERATAVAHGRARALRQPITKGGAG